jgi:hypothetical protein
VKVILDLFVISALVLCMKLTWGMACEEQESWLFTYYAGNLVICIFVPALLVTWLYTPSKTEEGSEPPEE